jgi:hypothetical protein
VLERMRTFRLPCTALWFFPAALFAGLIVRVHTTPRLPPAGAPDAEAAARITRAVRDAEPSYWRKAFETYPGDPWAQGVDFAVQERQLVLHLAARENVRIGAVLDVIDRDVKASRGAAPLPYDRGRVAPCMPQPFYD